MHDMFPLRGIDLFKVSTHCTCPSTLHLSLHTTHVPPHYTCPSTHYTCPSTHYTCPSTHYTCPSTLPCPSTHYTCPSTLHMSSTHYTCPSTHYTCPSTQSLLRTVPHSHEKALSCTDVCWEYTHPNLSTLCSPISAPHPSYM